MAVAYLVTYLVISFLVIINMYIAVILENFSQVRQKAYIFFALFSVVSIEDSRQVEYTGWLKSWPLPYLSIKLYLN